VTRSTFNILPNALARMPIPCLPFGQRASANRLGTHFPAGGRKRAPTLRAANIACRLHGFRHAFCRNVAEAGVPKGTMLDMMGHVSTAMLTRDSDIRLLARRDAVGAVESRVCVGVRRESPKAGIDGFTSTAVSR
jgi:hypothetical protein